MSCCSAYRIFCQTSHKNSREQKKYVPKKNPKKNDHLLTHEMTICCRFICMYIVQCVVGSLFVWSSFVFLSHEIIIFFIISSTSFHYNVDFRWIFFYLLNALHTPCDQYALCNANALTIPLEHVECRVCARGGQSSGYILNLLFGFLICM